MRLLLIAFIWKHGQLMCRMLGYHMQLYTRAGHAHLRLVKVTREEC
jgi:hypothetical protein